MDLNLNLNFNNNEFKRKLNIAMEYCSDIGGFIFKKKSTWFLIVFGGSVGLLYHRMKNLSKTQLIALSKEKISKYFEQSQQVSNNAVCVIIKSYLIEKDLIKENIDIGYLMLKIRSSKAEERKQLTEQLKTSIFSKLFTALYSIPLTLLLNRITIDIIGKYCYLDYIIYSRNNRLIDEHSETNFLSFSNYLYTIKFKSYIELIQNIVADSLSDWQLEESSTYEGVLRLLINIRKRFEDKKVLLKLDNGQSLLSYLIPLESNQHIYDAKTRQLLAEVLNIFESDKFYDIFKITINESFLWFTQSLRKDFDSINKSHNNNNSNTTKLITNPMFFEMEIPVSPTIPNIALLPKINQHINTLLNQDNGFIESIINEISKLEKFKQFNYSILTNNINFNKLNFK